MMNKKFNKRILLFFIPVILGYVIMEALTQNLPLSYNYINEYISKNKNEIEILVLGSSQMTNAINPELIDTPTLNLSSGNQHHDTDFKLLKALEEDFSKLNTVILEVSYSHFELPHNGKYFWKNSAYLKYYGVNAFERRTYFKDKLLYLAFPSFFSKKILKHYVKQKEIREYNLFGFNTNGYFGRFKNLDYNESKIAETNFKINYQPDTEIFKINTALFFEMLDFLKEKNLTTIICTPPMYKSYLPKRVPEILRRRDSILRVIQLKYPEIILFEKEEDITNYTVFDYWNQSHLNPDGATKFTNSLNELIKNLR